MAYQILCDGFPIFDPRDDELIVQNPKCNLEANKVGEASFSIFADHPHYSKFQKLRSIVEILEDHETIFKGRVTADTIDFENMKSVDVEGVLSFFNDTFFEPFVFPDDFTDDHNYKNAAESGNVIEYFLGYIIDFHNAQVEEAKQFKLGRVTVTDPNNYISRSSQDYASTWETLESKLFKSSLGGFLCVRYEEDGNYIDYLSEFEEVNPQRIEYGKNLLDVTSDSSALETFSAILPLGASDDDGVRLKLSWVKDWDIDDDISQRGFMLYSKSAVEKFGWIVAPVADTTFDDVTMEDNLLLRGMEYIESKGNLLKNTLTFKAVDLHFSDKQIESFRICKKVTATSIPHGHSETYNLTKLALDLQNPQNTEITIGDTQLSMTDINARNKSDTEQELKKVSAKAVKWIVEEYSLSHNPNKPQLEWSSTMPAYAEGMCLWTRQKITYGNGSVQYTDPVCDNTWQSIKLADLKLEENFTSEIKQLKDSITLNVTGSLGSKAEIVLSAGGTEHKTELELSKVREAFANDNTAIEISAGVITFNSGTIVINSNNFKVSSTGVVEATSGTIGAITLSETGIYSNNENYPASYAGWYRPLTISTSSNCFFAGAKDAAGADAKFLVTYGGRMTATDAVINGEIEAVDGVYTAKLSKSALDFFYKGDKCVSLKTKYHSNANDMGMTICVEEMGKYFMISHSVAYVGDGKWAYEIDYYLNVGFSSNYDEKHIFQTSARFLDKVYFSGSGAYFNALYLRNNAFIKSVDASDNVGEEMLGCDGTWVEVGASGGSTQIRGKTIKSAASITVSSDRNAKNSIETLPEPYEAFFDALAPVRFKYNEGTSGRYHVGYIAQDVLTALESAGLSSMDFAGYVDINKTGELGLAYDEFVALLHLKIKRLEQRIKEMESEPK